jgi:Fe-S-cluster containining protein
MADMISEKDLFVCKQCGQCCQGFGGTVICSEDLQAIADFLSIPAAQLKEKYCTYSGTKIVLAQQADGYCIFFDKNCSIHPVKPQMCRKWPFIDSLLVDITNWRIMAGSCPGMRTDWTDEEILAFVRKKIDKPY